MGENIQSQSSAETDPFLKHLSTSNSAQDARVKTRLLSSGLFVHEQFVDTLLDEYTKWLEAHTPSSTRSKAKCMRRLFGTETPQVFYVLDGKECLPGFLMPIKGEVNLAPALFVRSQSPMLNVESYLHPRDPLLQTLPGISAIQKNQEPFRLELKIREKTVRVRDEVLKEFANCLKGSPKLTERFPQALLALRWCIQPLLEVLSEGKETGRKQGCFVPRQYSEQQDIMLIRSGNIIFVLKTPDLSLLRCYSLHGKQFSELVKSELSALSSQGGSQAGCPRGSQVSAQGQIGPLQLERRNPKYVARVKLKGTFYSLEFRAFLEVLKGVRRSPTLRRSCQGRYTVETCLKALGEQLKFADWVNVGQTGHSAGSKAPRRELKYGKWTFVTGKDNTITRCLERIQQQNRP